MKRNLIYLLLCLLGAIMQATSASAFTLRVEVWPEGGGSVSGGGEYEEGASIWLSSNNHNGFVFDGWFDGDEKVSDSGSFYYTMPARDVVLQARYNYSPGSPDDPAMPDTVKYYSFTTTVKPHGAGSVYPDAGKYAAGKTVSLWASANSGFRFTAWLDEKGNTLGTDSELNYIMPSANVNLTAEYVYDPTSPGDPSEPKPSHRVEVRCVPDGGGSFNFSNESFTEGQSVNIYAYNNSGFVFRRWTDADGNVLGSDQTLEYVVGTTDAVINGEFEFAPENPSNPSKNYWNPASGEVIVDDFSAGYLADAVSQTVRNGGGNDSDVSMITVAGRVNVYDTGVADRFGNCTLLDFSRVSGLDEVPSYAFDYTSLETILLPSTVGTIGYRAFADCASLSSLTCYAMVPPTVDASAFNGVSDGLVVYVPAESLPLYQEADVWKDFIILPIVSNAHALEVSFPEECSDGRYLNCSIELLNAKNGIRQKYLVSDRKVYVFNGLMKDETYNVYLLSRNSHQLGVIENVTIGDEDMAVTFSDLVTLGKAELKVVTPDGNDVTGQTIIEWALARDNGDSSYLGKGASVGDLVSGDKLRCKITLNDVLGAKYYNPSDVEVVAEGELTTAEVELTVIPEVMLSGRVKDSDGNNLYGASVSAIQTINGISKHTSTTQTDRDGNWSMNVSAVPGVVVNYAAPECITQIDTIQEFEKDVAELKLGDVKLRSINGARITYGFTFKAAGEELKDYYDGYQNVDFAVINKTQGCEYNNLSAQYPILVVMDESIKASDVLEITATSRTGEFAPVTTEVAIDENLRGSAEFPILGNGGIKASYGTTANSAVIGMLYNDTGNFLKKGSFIGNEISFTGLAAGDYTLIAMGESAMMNSVLRLDGFAEIGMEKGVDYVPASVTVSPGEYSAVEFGEIPTLDEGKLSYTSFESTALNFNKSSVTTGNYLTLSAKTDFKPIYKQEVSSVTLIVDLPEGCNLVENSVIQGANLLPYTLDNSRLSIELGESYTSQVRFCVMPTRGGQVTAAASVGFDYNCNRITQPIGSAIAAVKDLEIRVPKVIAGEEFTVSGVAPGRSDVKIYEDNVLLGSGKADATGTYTVKCKLTEPYNLSIHSIHGEIITQAGATLLSETKDVKYDFNALEVSKVTMYHWNPEMRVTYESVFDFQNPTTKPNQWTVYYPKKKFTYTVEFTANDTTRISNVVLYVHTANDKVIPLYPMFDKNKNLWVADIDMGSSNDGYYPVNVSVDFDSNTEALVDAKEISDNIAELQAYSEEYEFGVALLNEYMKNLTSPEEIDYDYLSQQLGFELRDYDASEDVTIELPEDFDSWTDEEKDDYLSRQFDTYEAESDSKIALFSNLDKLMSYSSDINLVLEDGMEFHMSTADKWNANTLIESGFVEVKSTDETQTFYYRYTEEGIDAVDIVGNIAVSILFGKNADMLKSGDNNMLDYYKDCMNKIGKAEKIINAIMLELTTLSKKPLEELEEAERLLNKDIDKVNRYILISNKGGKAYLKWNSELLRLKWQLASAQLAKKICKPIVRKALKCIPIAGYLATLVDCYQKAERLLSLFKSIPDPCKDDQAMADALKAKCITLWGSIGALAIGDILGNASSDSAIIGGVFSSLITAGTSLTATLGGLLLKSLLAVGSVVADIYIDKGINDLYYEISELQCLKDCGKPGQPACPEPPKDNSDGNGGSYDSQCPDDNVKIDPSGFVYEAVPSNRVQGVEATIFYKETKEDMYGDPYEEVVLWNAEEYAQENPLFTDENGMYRWDVPQGLWQVKFEKEGYETTFSEWLPVPPPQLEVNIPIVQNSQPEVISARAYETGVEVTFNKFMDISTLTTANIYVTAAGEKVNGNVVMVNEEISDPFASEQNLSDAPHYASCVRFVPETPLSMVDGEIRLIVNRSVTSYSGIPMADTYSQTIDIEKEVMDIVADEVEVLYGGEKAITVYALPSDATPGRTLHVESSSVMIASINGSDFILDEEGKATVVVKGELPGRVSLLFSIEGISVTGETTVDVVTELSGIPVPKASRASGSILYSGTEVFLTTTAENGIIYYTLDGSCPCDDAGSRQIYSSPIIIDRDVEILTMTQVGEETSEVVGYSYTVKQSSMVYNLKEGWNWISTNINSDKASDWMENEAVKTVKSGDCVTERDDDGNLVDNVGDMLSAQSYKVEAVSAEKLSKSGVAVNPGNPIPVKTGWNRLGYLSDQTMTVAEAFATTKVEPLDAVVGQNGFAQYDGSMWIGTLSTLIPGAGYAYISGNDKNIIYNTSIVSKAAAHYARGLKAASRYAVDVNRYPDVMCVIATLEDSEDVDVDLETCQLFAFCGSECRGVATMIDGVAFMTVYGNVGDNITFKAVSQAEEEFIGPSIVFKETLLGDITAPYVIPLSPSGVKEVECDGNIAVFSESKYLYVEGVDPNEVENLAMYDLNGRKVLQCQMITEGGISVADIPADAYIVSVETADGFTYHKIIIR